MQPLSAEEVLQLWERGEGRGPAEQAFTLLARARAGVPADHLTAMTVGESETALLELRVATYGPRLLAVDTCPACATAVELAIDAATLVEAKDAARGAAGLPGESASRLVSVSVDGWQLLVGSPTVGDLLAIAGVADPLQARDELLRRCLRDVRTPAGLASETTAVAAILPAAVRARVAEAIEREDAGAQLTATLDCPDCHHVWDVVLDVGAYLWREVTASARRLLREVHELATRYGWSEGAILRLSSSRRHAYLEGRWA